MMKLIGILTLTLILMTSLVLAVGQGTPDTQGSDDQGNGTGDSGTEDPGQGMQAETNESGQGMQENTGTQQENQGEEAQLQNQIRTENKIQTGNYTFEEGKQLHVREQSNNRLQMQVGNVSAHTFMDLFQEQGQNRTMLKVKLSNGVNTEVKVMPDAASETALARLRLNVCSEENGCQIELKEVGQGEQVRVAYDVQAQKQAKVFGLFKTTMQVQAQVDAENGEIIQVKKPWWAFLASESEE
ncbi:MAG: hypothetical protein ABIA93_07140 [Candidatus Woesearchaeota archaeon]